MVRLVSALHPGGGDPWDHPGPEATREDTDRLYEEQQLLPSVWKAHWECPRAGPGRDTSMSHYAYMESSRISVNDPPFSAIIYAAIRKGDTVNQEKIKAAWPEEYEEFWLRFNAPGGFLPRESKPLIKDNGGL